MKRINHGKYVRIIGDILWITPGAYFALLLLAPVALLLAIFDSPIALSFLIGFHLISFFFSHAYLKFLRTLTYVFRYANSILSIRFFYHLSSLTNSGAMFIDIGDQASVEEFYSTKKRSIRRRMLKIIPEKAKSLGISSQVRSSNNVGLENMRLQYLHSRKFNLPWKFMYLYVFGLFCNAGLLIEYRINDTLVAHNVCLPFGSSHTIFQYAAMPEHESSGIWFLNIAKNMEIAISEGSVLLNGMTPEHKEEAKRNAGFLFTDSPVLIDQLYGGRDSGHRDA